MLPANCYIRSEAVELRCSGSSVNRQFLILAWSSWLLQTEDFQVARAFAAFRRAGRAAGPSGMEAARVAVDDESAPGLPPARTGEPPTGLPTPPLLAPQG
jgi:hypothetical protein